MSRASLTDIVRRYSSACENRDRAALERLLAENFRFTSPHADRAPRREECA